MAEQVGETTTIRCASCGKKIRVPTVATGKRARCPGCGTTFVVPEAGGGGQDAESEKIHFACEACGARIKVRRAAAGRRVKCPKCGSLVSAPAPEALSAEAAGAPSGVGGGSSLLDELAAAEQGGEAVARPAAVPAASPCPECGAAMAAGAVVCGSCGYNVEKGRRGKPAAGEAGMAVAAAVGGAAKLAGSFLLGCIGSAVGAAIGAGIWYGVAMATEYEIGWIAWGLGGLAGLGMYVGYRQSSSVGGVIAAGMAVLGILAAKVCMFYAIFQPLFADPRTDMAAMREQLASAIASDLVDEGSNSSEEDEQAFERAWALAEAEAEGRVGAMSDDEVRRRFELEVVVSAVRTEIFEGMEVEGDDEGAFERAWAQADKQAAERVSAMSDDERRQRFEVAMAEREEDAAEIEEKVRSSIWRFMFGWMDILFFGLAIVTSYRVGGGGISFGGD